jgi:hypothetical protein
LLLKWSIFGVSIFGFVNTRPIIFVNLIVCFRSERNSDIVSNIEFHIRKNYLFTDEQIFVIFISSFLENNFSLLGVGTDVMKILCQISKETKLHLDLVPDHSAKQFYNKNGFRLSDLAQFRREYWEIY